VKNPPSVSRTEYVFRRFPRIAVGYLPGAGDRDARATAPSGENSRDYHNVYIITAVVRARAARHGPGDRSRPSARLSVRLSDRRRRTAKSNVIFSARGGVRVRPRARARAPSTPSNEIYRAVINRRRHT